MVVEMDFVTADFIMIIFVYNQNGQTEKNQKNYNPSLVLLKGAGSMWRWAVSGPQAIVWRPLF